MADSSPRYSQEGKYWDRPPGTAISAGTIESIGATTGAGVADNDIAANEQGALHICGVYKIPNPDDTAFAQDAEVEWDATNSKAVIATTGDFDIGTAYRPYVAGDFYVYVLLNSRVG